LAQGLPIVASGPIRPRQDLEALQLRAERHRRRPDGNQRLHTLWWRAKDAGLLGSHSVADVTLMWDAACTGLAMPEICGPMQRAHGERIWMDPLTALLSGTYGLADAQARTPRDALAR
jgi:hypothetical protein